MDFIKEYQPVVEQFPGRCVIRTNTYCKNFSHICFLVAEAKKDFPDLKDNLIEIAHYGGQHYKGTFGIEFTPTGEVPDSYEKISELEFTL